jgi:hypothetical protein
VCKIPHRHLPQYTDGLQKITGKYPPCREQPIKETLRQPLVPSFAPIMDVAGITLASPPAAAYTETQPGHKPRMPDRTTPKRTIARRFRLQMFPFRLSRRSFLASPLLTTALLLGLVATGRAESPSAYLNQLPDPPGSGCFVNGQGDPAFFARIDQVSERLNEEIAERKRVLKEAQSRNSKTIQEAMMAQPGSEGVDAETLKNMSREAKRKKAEQVMEEQMGVSMEELKNLKKTNRQGQEGWGKAMMGQMQADAAMDPARAAKNAQGNMQTAGLAQRQSELAHKIQAALAKWEQKMTEIEPNPDADEMRKAIETQMRQQGDGEMLTGLKDVLPQENATTRTYREAVKTEEDKLKAMQAAYRDCPDLNFQKRRVFTARESYCTNLSVPYLAALKGYQTAVIGALPDAEELDKVQMEIQKIQFGVEMPPEQREMAGLGMVQDYIKKLRTAYMFDLTSGPYEELPCDGKLGR